MSAIRIPTAIMMTTPVDIVILDAADSVTSATRRYIQLGATTQAAEGRPYCKRFPVLQSVVIDCNY